jgi:hypothetical protein
MEPLQIGLREGCVLVYEVVHGRHTGEPTGGTDSRPGSASAGDFARGMDRAEWSSPQ